MDWPQLAVPPAYRPPAGQHWLQMDWQQPTVLQALRHRQTPTEQCSEHRLLADVMTWPSLGGRAANVQRHRNTERKLCLQISNNKLHQMYTKHFVK